MPPYRIPFNAQVSTEPAQSMSNPLMALIDQLKFIGRPKDIELPAEGPMDPDLLRVNVDQMLRSGAQVADPLGGLRRALGR